MGSHLSCSVGSGNSEDNMSKDTLDDKLRMILRGHVFSLTSLDSDGDQTERNSVSQIKQAFADDANQKLMDGSINGVGVYEVEHPESEDWNRMTGQEWYSAFERELDKWHPPVVFPDAVRERVLNTARKVAGLIEGNKK